MARERLLAPRGGVIDGCDHDLVFMRLIAAVLLIVLASVVALAITRPESFWSLDGPSLETSLEHEFGYEVEACDRTSDTH